jgi:hypothetical protein
MESVDTIIRTSDRKTFKRCRQLWQFSSKIRENWTPLFRTPALDFGTAIHRALQAYYEPSTWDDYNLRCKNAMEGFFASISEVEQKVRVAGLELELRFDEPRAMGMEMLDYYFQWAPKHDDFRPILVEQEFSVPIPGYPFLRYEGRVDLVVENEYGYWIWDHKTAASFQGTEWLVLDDQCTSYAWGLLAQLGLDIKGVMYNELSKSPPHPPRRLKSGGFSIAKNQDTTFELYLKTVTDAGQNPRWYRDYLLYLKHNPKEYIRRTQIRFTPGQLDIVERRIQKEALEMANPDVAIFPTPSAWNCQRCRFLQPCIALQQGLDHQAILEELYEKRV